MGNLFDDARVLGNAVIEAHEVIELADSRGELKECVAGMCLPDSSFEDEDTPKRIFRSCLLHLLIRPAWNDEKERHVKAFLYSPRDVQEYVIAMLLALSDPNYDKDAGVMRQAAHLAGITQESRIYAAHNTLRAISQNTLTVLEALVEDER